MKKLFSCIVLFTIILSAKTGKAQSGIQLGPCISGTSCIQVQGQAQTQNGGTGLNNPSGFLFFNGSSSNPTQMMTIPNSYLTGSISVSGTPLNGQFAQWTGSNTLQGINNIPYSSISGTPVIPTTANWPNAGSCTVNEYITGLTNGTAPTCSSLSLFSPTTAGTVPPSGGGTANFLRADGTWAAPSGGQVVYPGTGISVTGTNPYTVSLVTPVAVSNGGTGANSASQALANLGGCALAGCSLTGALSGTTATFSSTVQTPSLIDTSLGTSTNPICPNGTGGSLTTSGCTVPLSSIPLFTSSSNGLTPASGGGTANFLRADGNWAAPVPTLHTQIFTASGTFTYPLGTTIYTTYQWTIVGGGGAGGGGSSGVSGGGGGAGATAKFLDTAESSGNSVTVTVGAGGVGVAGTGTGGGMSSVGPFTGSITVEAEGGTAGGGANTPSGNPGGLGGVPSYGSPDSIIGGDGGAGVSNSASEGSSGGASSMGGGGAGGVGGTITNGNPGRAFGSGGGGGSSNSAAAGGNGAPGIVIVTWMQ